ncbi:TPA: hypothetical protein H1005_01945 [archaeon]|uniref:Uncharacterized protein n=1 Tax=Candidatus Naiadarchaeum limnaeum TaxID=2756139 RepID=A0A832V1P7_9ARCH|nr:hypothetical protein [Candidatus Naiadarchaeales archaeon SRR2090153.bin1042]HIK00461.1 hypothetical protein [Candidatus Naiadarchaeum limnaeum]
MRVVILIQMDTIRQLRKLPRSMPEKIMEILKKGIKIRFHYQHLIAKEEVVNLLEILRKNVEEANAILKKVSYPELGIRYIERSGRIVIFFKVLLR